MPTTLKELQKLTLQLDQNYRTLLSSGFKSDFTPRKLHRTFNRRRRAIRAVETQDTVEPITEISDDDDDETNMIANIATDDPLDEYWRQNLIINGIKTLTAKQRNFAKEKNLCFACLKPGHRAGQCPNKPKYPPKYKPKQSSFRPPFKPRQRNISEIAAEINELSPEECDTLDKVINNIPDDSDDPYEQLTTTYDDYYGSAIDPVEVNTITIDALEFHIPKRSLEYNIPFENKIIPTLIDTGAQQNFIHTDYRATALGSPARRNEI